MEPQEAVSPQDWPSTIQYLNQPLHSDNLTSKQIKYLASPPSQPLPTVALPLSPSTRVTIRRVEDPTHPAHTQFGLFANQWLPPDALVVPYLGLVHSDAEDDTDPTSNYDLSLDREAEVSIDASRVGNEARMTNDYRGVPRPMIDTAKLKKGEKLGPNAEFRDIWFQHGDSQGGEKGIAIFVLCAGKSGKRSQGIVAGEEILVNYGKGFWKARAEEA